MVRIRRQMQSNHQQQETLTPKKDNRTKSEKKLEPLKTVTSKTEGPAVLVGLARKQAYGAGLLGIHVF